ncbi:MAG: NAD(P)-dependent oxidoreductase [Betaproteobacteria bacterium]|jgi:3-hydroxyisobutyrate dehydrogenase
MSGTQPLQTVGFIGLGAMGYPMAKQLAAAGHSLRVVDANPSTAQRFADECAAVVEATPAGAARSGVVITMLPSSAEVETVILGSPDRPGVLAGLAPGGLVIDMSSSDPMRTRELARAVQAAGSMMVDAPVSGSVRRARDGSLAIMFGGAVDELERCRPVLSRMGSAIFHVGQVGAGHAMKALNNYVSAAGLVAAVEALRVGERFGIDPRVMTEVLNASTGRNNTTENKISQFMLSGTYASGFLLRLMAKDVGIAVALADALGVDAPLGHTCSDLWNGAARECDPAADHTEMYRLGRR